MSQIRHKLDVNMTICQHFMMLHLLSVTSFLVIIYSFNCDITTILNTNVRSRKELVVKYMKTQNIQNDQSHISDKNITELSFVQKIELLSQPNVILRVYTGAVTKLQCKLNPRQLGKKTVMWLYSPTNLSFILLQEDETVIKNWNLTIYNTQFQHAGVYRCATDRHYDGVVLLEVVDEEKYNVVKPVSSHGPYASKPVALNSQLMVFSVWSEWSECSRCDLVGRKRRYGICYISLINEANSAKNKQDARIEEGTLKLFHTFPGGIPCRSQILPTSIRNIKPVETRNNEIMIALCKVKCKDSILKILSKSGDIIETANNTAGIYSLSQNKPAQPPMPTRTIMYVEPGKKVVIKCYGTTLRDIPFTWRVDTQEMSPRDLDRQSNGRVHLNARDHIVFTYVLYSDAHVYSCWQDNVLAGVVKLRVQHGAESTYRARFTLFAVIIILTMLLGHTLRLLRYRRRYLGIT